MITAPKHYAVIARLGALCRDFGRSPSDYLFNDLQCAHTRLLIDMEVHQILLEQEDIIIQREQAKAKASSRGYKSHG